MTLPTTKTGGVYKVQTKDFKASQYDHVEDNYKKAELKDRSKYVGGYKVQRDLYSAYLLKTATRNLINLTGRSVSMDLKTFKAAEQSDL